MAEGTILGFNESGEAVIQLDDGTKTVVPTGEMQTLPEGSNKPLRILEEQHPDISVVDRAKTSLFQRGVEEEVKDYEKKGFNVDVDDTGELEVWKDGDAVRRRVDPQTGAFSSDIAGDTADLSAEFVHGAAQTAAAIPKIGGVMAAPLTGGASIPAGMAAGGAIGAGVEAGLQGLGMLLGERDDFNAAAIGTEAVAGAAYPGASSAFNQFGGKELFKGAMKGAGKKLPTSWARRLLRPQPR